MRPVVTALACILLWTAAAPLARAQQEIELKLETPPAVAPLHEETPQTAQPSPTGSVQLPSKIEAIVHGKPPAITAESAILVDAETGQVLFERNAFAKRPIASTTKIMTAIVALERSNLNDIVVASRKAASIPHTSLHLKVGERIPMRDLLTGMLVRSANDAAVAVAEHVAGSVSAFAKLMNEKAKEIGAKNSHFINPNGLYVPGHYSTAYDLALITRYALQIPEFNEMANTRKATITRSINSKDVVVVQKSHFMNTYAGADGVKSGYTRESGNCFVGSATRKGWRLISVVLKSDYANGDTGVLMDYGYSNFRRVVLTPEGTMFRSSRVRGVDSVPAVTAGTLEVGVPRKGETGQLTTKTHFLSLSVPIKRGQTVGDLTAYIDGVAVASVPLTATRDIEATAVGRLSRWAGQGLILLVCLGLCVRYAGAASKNYRRGRGRIAAQIRRTDSYR